MKVNGIDIDATPEQIIAKLQVEVEENSGVTLFRRTKSLGSNMQFSCPFHSGGMERKPSCGMSREVTYGGGKVYEAGMVHCFTCNYTNPLPIFISDVLGRMDAGFYGNQWLKKNFVASEVITRPKLDLNFGRGVQVFEPEYKTIPEHELDKYRWVHPYMYTRKLTDELIEMFDVGYDKLNDSLTFPVRNKDGETVFINRRSVTTKFHKYGEDDPKTEFLYGEYELEKYSDWFEGSEYEGKLYIVESVINCLTLWKMKVPAVALMGVGGGGQITLLKQRPERMLVLALDPDEAGQRAQLKLYDKLASEKVVKFLVYPEEFYVNKWDINDAPELLDIGNTHL